MAPVYVKIDRVFIADLDRDDASRLIVGAVAGLEHDRRMALVTQRSCARPMGADEIDVLLDRDAEPGVDSSGAPAVNRSVHA